jgi:hypothetical protein
MSVNSKSEIRNPKQIRISNDQSPKRFEHLYFLFFDIVSTNFIKSGEIRASDFVFD